MKFIHVNSNDINDWMEIQNSIDKKYVDWPENREPPDLSLEYASNIFNIINGHTIVECGTGLGREFMGDSMRYWMNKTSAQTIYCIDLAETWINSVKNEFGNDSRIIYCLEDCLDVAPRVESIDLIYMDFKPWPFSGNNRAEKYLTLYNLSNKPKLILIDDSDHPSPWKQTLVVPQAIEDGYYVIYVGRHTLLVRSDVYAQNSNAFANKIVQ